MFRKRFLVLCSAVIIASTTVTPAFASAHHHSSSNKHYAACTVKNCNRTAKHYHNGTCYYGHTSHKGSCSNSYHH